MPVFPPECLAGCNFACSQDCATAAPLCFLGCHSSTTVDGPSAGAHPSFTSCATQCSCTLAAMSVLFDVIDATSLYQQQCSCIVTLPDTMLMLNVVMTVVRARSALVPAVCRQWAGNAAGWCRSFGKPAHDSTVQQLSQVFTARARIAPAASRSAHRRQHGARTGGVAIFEAAQARDKDCGGRGAWGITRSGPVDGLVGR